jgi:hypothetical protein
LIEIKECHHISFVYSVECRLGAHHNAGPGTTSVCASIGRYLGNRFTGQSFEFLTHTVHASAQVSHLRSATFRAHHWSNRAASETHEQTVVPLNDCCRTVLACGDFAACDAGRKSRTAFAVEDANNASIAAKRLDEPFAKQS